MPISHLLEGVAGAQNQRFFHMPSNNLEPNWKAIGGFAAGQCQRWMPAHIKRRGEAECVPQLRPEYAERHQPRLVQRGSWRA